MARISPFSSPLMLGFDRLEQVLDRVSRTGNDGYPPYNVVQVGEDRLRISVAVAGFDEGDLSVSVEQNQLHIRGRHEDEPGVVYLHRGIATRQFQRSFLLAEGIEVASATLDKGLLHVDLTRPLAADSVKTIDIKTSGKKATLAQGETIRHRVAEHGESD
jgi:HSP20 family molecular chaperone IbpA